MTVDLRDYEEFVVRKGRLYMFSVTDGYLRWTNSPYDAWRHKRRDKARMVAKRIGGRVCAFNPVTGEVY